MVFFWIEDFFFRDFLLTGFFLRMGGSLTQAPDWLSGKPTFSREVAGYKMATTASLPVELTTDSFTPPC